MTAPPQIITRALTFAFAPSVSATTGLPEIMEVAVIPLGDASSASAGGTFAGGVKTQTVELVSPGPNVASFDLIPSYSPGLNVPILYRVMWRAGVMGRTFTYDFAMPDADVDFENLLSQGLVIDGEVYLQHDDLGVPNRVCRLNAQGIPTDSHGDPVAVVGDIQGLTNSLSVETVNRIAADSDIRATLESEMHAQDAANLNTAKVYVDNKTATNSNNLATEVAQRTNADTALQGSINTKANQLQSQIDVLVTSTGHTNDSLTAKADLVGGKVPVSQIPPQAFTTAIPVPNQAAMLALSTTVAQQGDLAIQPNSVWLLNANDPSQLSNWINLTNINSVNGQRGVVVLSAADVGAIPVGGSVAQNQVTGLSTALLAKTDVTATTALQGQVTNLANDPTTVHTVAGTIPDPLMPPDIALVNTSGQVTNKNGQVVAAGGPGGTGAVLSVNGKTGTVVLNLNDVSGSGTIAQSQVNGLPTALSGKASTTDPRFTDARTPLSHAASHAAGGSDAILVGQSQVTGLSTVLTNNGLTNVSNHGNRINALETAVAGGGGGTGTGSPAKTTWWDGPGATTDFSTVVIKSPFGKATSDGHLYYNPAGAAESESVFPYVTPNGHLKLVARNETNPVDPAMATQASLDVTNTTVASKANQSALNALSTTVDTKATQADLNATNVNVNTKASQTDLNSTNAQLASKANQSDLTALSNTVNTKANQSALDATNATVTTNANVLTSKADLVGGTVPLAQIATLPQSKVTNLTTDLAAKAPLVGGVVPVANIPTNIPQSSVVGLSTALSSAVQVDGTGKVPLSQIPPGAITSSVKVANQPAMLALTAAQVQPGDFAIIDGVGSYLLIAADPSQMSSWQALSGASSPVQSVNTKLGDVVLTWTDVGAMAANAVIPISQITNLQPTLNTFATTTSVDTKLLAKTAFTDVQNMFYTSSMVKRADFVAITTIGSLAGQQTADNVLMPVGAIVLLTNQSDSRTHGPWVVASGSWSRPPDYATGSWVARDSIVIVANQTGVTNPNSVNPNTIWQMNATSGPVDTATTTWVKIGWTAPPFAPVQGNGIAITGTAPAMNIAAKVDPGQGLTNTVTGLATDKTKTPGKFLATVPAGSVSAVITHNLNTSSPIVSIWDTGSNTLVLAGVTANTVNQVTIEFASAPASGQYRVCVLG